MKTGALALYSVCLSGLIYLLVTAAAVVTLFGVLTAIFLGSDGRNSPHPGATSEALVLLLPALVTGAIMTRARPIFHPRFTTPAGIIIVLAVAGMADRGPTGAAFLLHATAAGLLSTLGATVAARKRRTGTVLAT